MKNRKKYLTTAYLMLYANLDAECQSIEWEMKDALKKFFWQSITSKEIEDIIGSIDVRLNMDNNPKHFTHLLWTVRIFLQMALFGKV